MQIAIQKCNQHSLSNFSIHCVYCIDNMLSPSEVKLKVSFYQGSSKKSDINGNIECMRTIMVEAEDTSVDLILFPELFLVGYDIGLLNMHKLSITQDSNEIKLLQSLCIKHHASIAFGYPEIVISNEETIYYNSCMLIDCRGDVALNYRKTHLPRYKYEEYIFSAGDEHPVIQLYIPRLEIAIKIGILICYDCEFPEPARILALKGAQIILIPTALTTGTTAKNIPIITIPSRAMENHVYIIYSNFVGDCNIQCENSERIIDSDYCGQSCIISPDGNEIIRANHIDIGLYSQELLINSIEYTKLFEEVDYLADRRPGLYNQLNLM